MAAASDPGEPLGCPRARAGGDARGEQGPGGLLRAGRTLRHRDRAAGWDRLAFTAGGGIWSTASPALCCPSHCGSFLPSLHSPRHSDFTALIYPPAPPPVQQEKPTGLFKVQQHQDTSKGSLQRAGSSSSSQKSHQREMLSPSQKEEPRGRGLC